MARRNAAPLARVAMLALCVLVAAPLGAGAAFTDAPGSLDPALDRRIAADPGAVIDALISVEPPAGPADVTRAQRLGLRVLRLYEDFGVLYAVGAGRDLQKLGRLPRVTHVGENARLRLFGETATVATRAREAWDAKSTSTTPVTVGGQVVDGAGVGVAVVDSGVDGTHPDLAPALAVNQKFICSTPGLTNNGFCYGNSLVGSLLYGGPITGCTTTLWARLPNTDTTGGHGTHVAGIVAGRGIASDGRFMGAAPGAAIYGLGVGDSALIIAALEAFQWVNCNHDSAAPPIRVVSNSWGPPGGGGSFKASNPINQAANALVAKGITVLFAAGNDGGSGSGDSVNTYAKNPTPGVIGVASYDDQERATRSGSLSDFSSRGLSTDSEKNNWPDVSAPGDAITSTATLTSTCAGPPLAFAYYPYYTRLSGTSMATPHVAGIVALLLQVKQTLTPAEIEDVLEDNAVQFSTPGGYVRDPGNVTNGINYGAGHGLIDAIASLCALGVCGGSPLPRVSQNPHVYIGGVDAQLVRGVQWTDVSGVPVLLAERSLVSGDLVSYPLASGQPAAFRVMGPGGPTIVPTMLAADSIGGLRMNATFTFGAPGAYTVESQINFGGSLVSFDSFVVRVVGSLVRT